jgi:hypothetical protein
MPGGRILRKTEMRLQFTKTEQNRGLKHLHIDSEFTQRLETVLLSQCQDLRKSR